MFCGTTPNPAGRGRTKGEEVTATKLQELEEMAAQLLATARKLPPGPDRAKALEQIGRFRVRIADLQSRKSETARKS